METSEVRAAFSTLAHAAVARANQDGEGAEPYRHQSAVFDTARDERITSLEVFQPAVLAAAALPDFATRFGDAERITLQLVYEVFTRLPGSSWDQAICSAVFEDFLRELEDPDWTFVLVANLFSFACTEPYLDLGDGVSIRQRGVEMLQSSLGWREFELDHLSSDWMEGAGQSEHILWVEDKEQKTPETFLVGNSETGHAKAQRALGALWLHGEGDVQIGRIFHAHSAHVRLKPGGLVRSGTPVRHAFGTPYQLGSADLEGVRSSYRDLARLEALGDAAPPNLALALRRFSALYGRAIQQREDRILDAITALEALLGSEDELTFKLSFRVASLLANTDEERAQLFRSMKRFYRTRSRIVHGLSFRQVDLDLITDDGPLRDVARRVLRGVIHLTLDGEYTLSRNFVNKDLDAILLHADERQRLRTAMGFDQAPDASDGTCIRPPAG